MSKNRKTLIAAIAVAVVAVICVAVALFLNLNKSKEQIVEKGVSYEVYYADKDTSSLKCEIYYTEEESQRKMVLAALEQIKAVPKLETLVSAVPDNLTINTVEIKNKILTLDVSKEYYELKSGEELLCRSALVWTLTSFDFIDGIKILIEGNELTQSNGQPIGEMSRENIIINPEISPDPESKFVTITLYFANEDATGLEKEERTIEVNPNKYLGLYVVEELIKGPENTKLIATVPAETIVRDIRTTDDGICYLNLSQEFVTKHNGGSAGEILTVYSIVNSLCELEGIEKVQFLIEGEKQAEYKGHLEFGMPFEAADIDI